MSSWIETELKLLLPNRAAWQRIRAALGPGRVVVQVNHFFDRADGALAAARIAVRLRSEGEEGEAQGIGGVPSSDVSGFLETLGSICRGVHLARNAGFTNRRERLRVELRDEEGAFEIEIEVEFDELAAIEVTPAPSKLERLRALPRSSP